jgi:hypothetical protein
VAAVLRGDPSLGQSVNNFIETNNLISDWDNLDYSEVPNVEAKRNRLVEIIPAKYRKRYLRWKNDYLSTPSGRSQWERYTQDPNFTLTVTVSAEQADGAIVNGFRWDNQGQLIAAIIVLGNKLDSGYPSSINYPIICSLAPGNLPPEAKGTILAATKIAHEFGHINHVKSMDGRRYQLQNRLIIQYYRIFFDNGRNCNDPRLLEFAKEMDGTPVSIQHDREAWAEVGALVFLKERLGPYRDLKMPGPVKQAIQTYYLAYPGRGL